MLTGAIDLICQYIVPQYRLILVKEPGIKPTHISDPISFHHFVQPLAHYSEEHFIAFHLDAKHQVIGYHEVSKGRSNSIFYLESRRLAAFRLSLDQGAFGTARQAAWLPALRPFSLAAGAGGIARGLSPAEAAHPPPQKSRVPQLGALLEHNYLLPSHYQWVILVIYSGDLYGNKRHSARKF